MRPGTDVDLNAEQSEAMQKLLDALENLDDVQAVYTNANT
jgi:transcriptional/translational regulatory protein YebC/TACO1